MTDRPQTIAPDLAAYTTPRAALLAAIAGVATWAIGPVLSKGVDLDALSTAFYRSWLGAVLAVVVLYATGGRLSMRALRLSAAGGAVLAVEMALFFTAINLTTVANTTIIEALQPLLIMVVVGPLFGERVRLEQVVWTLAALAGVTLAALGSASNASWSLAGDVVAAAALVAWAGYFVASKAARRHLGALEYQSALLVVCSLVLTPIAIISGQDLVIDDRRTLAGVVVLATVPTVGHVLINWSHRQVRLVTVSLLTLALPAMSTVLAAIFLDERIVLVQVVGVLIALASIATAVRRDASIATPMIAGAERPRVDEV